MTYQEICNRFKQAGIDSPEWDAALLLEHFCKADRLSLLGNPAKDFSSPTLEKAVERRAARYPLQYLLGEWEFYRQTYEVSPDCLIPRADTEILVEQAIRLLPQGAHFADLCTGSGCIAVSVLAERPDTCGLAVEKFPATLALATRNAAKNGVEGRFTPLLSDVLTEDFLSSQPLFDAILSNPPYIRKEVRSTLEPELNAEPAAALDGGEDGLIFYRRILEYGQAYLNPDGFFLFEIGFDQAEDLRRLGEENGFFHCTIIKDYGGNHRAVLLKRG